VLGHSEGALMRKATRASRVRRHNCGVVSVSGMGRKQRVVLRQQLPASRRRSAHDKAGARSHARAGSG
jgi:hypothetical protein